jgi:hypothetical protein
MPLNRRSLVVLASTLAFGAIGCRDIIDAENSNYAIINIETLQTGSTFAARPTGLFFNGGGIFLSSSFVARDSCIVQKYPPDITNPALDYLDVTPGVVVKFQRPGTEGTLTRRTQSGVQSYVLPDGTSIPFVPGDTATVEIPGVDGEFEPITAKARTAEAFTADPLVVPSSNQVDMPVTWRPGATAIPGSAMFYSLRFATPPTLTINREVACFFVDDGSASVPFEALFDFRDATVRSAAATRVRITANRVGNIVTHITSTFSTPVTVTQAP